MKFANGSSESILLLRQVGGLSRVSTSQRAGSRPFNFALANTLCMAAARRPGVRSRQTASFSFRWRWGRSRFPPGCCRSAGCPSRRSAAASASACRCRDRAGAPGFRRHAGPRVRGAVRLAGRLSAARPLAMDQSQNHSCTNIPSVLDPDVLLVTDANGHIGISLAKRVSQRGPQIAGRRAA